MPTQTTNYGLNKPDRGQTDWDGLLNGDLDAIDTLLAAREQTAHKAQANGYAGLDGSGKVPTAQLPTIPVQLSQDTDVLITTPADNEVLTYEAASSKWKNKAAGASGVTSVAGRTGAVTLAESDIANLTTDLAAKEATANKGQANGYASLDSGGKVPTSQLPAAVLGALEYQGTWDANTNSPALSSSVGTKGYFYKVSVAGSNTLDGNGSWEIGDWVVFNGTTWDKIDNTDSVSSVAGRTGAITLAESDITNLVSDLSGKVPTGRTISTTAPLTGGGDLSANRTLDISNFTGDAGSGGAKGAVPAPAAGDAAAAKYLKADGTWSKFVTFVDEEEITGLINSSNLVYTLAHTPIAGSVKLYSPDGARLRAGASKDYTISGNTITLAVAPVTGSDPHVADYRY